MTYKIPPTPPPIGTYVGTATAAGAPTTSGDPVGTSYIDGNGVAWAVTVSGNPDTWVQSLNQLVTMVPSKLVAGGLTDNSVAINQAIAACPAGGVVELPFSSTPYQVGNPIIHKPGVVLTQENGGSHSGGISVIPGSNLDVVIAGFSWFYNIVGPGGATAAYASGTSYTTGQQVAYDGYLYQSISGSTGQAPSGAATGNTYWGYLATGSAGYMEQVARLTIHPHDSGRTSFTVATALATAAYASGTSYTTGQYCLSGGFLYQSIAGSTGQTPTGAAASNSYWTYVLTTSLVVATVITTSSGTWVAGQGVCIQNISQGSSANGSWLINAASGSTFVIANTLVGAAYGGTGGTVGLGLGAVAALSSPHFAFEENTIQGPVDGHGFIYGLITRNGSQITGSLNEYRLSNNRIYMAGDATGNFGGGIGIFCNGGNVTDGFERDNIISGANGSWAMYTPASGTKFSGNHTYHCGGSGIYAFSANWSDISDNHVEASAAPANYGVVYGLLASINAPGVSIHDNQVDAPSGGPNSGNTYYGTYCTAPSSATHATVNHYGNTYTSRYGTPFGTAVFFDDINAVGLYVENGKNVIDTGWNKAYDQITAFTARIGRTVFDPWNMRSAVAPPHVPAPGQLIYPAHSKIDTGGVLPSSPGPYGYLAAVYNAITAYAVNAQVQSNGNVYQCILTSSGGNAPSGSTSSNTYWEYLQAVGVPPTYSGGTAYTVGMTVTYNGYIYQCLTAGTGTAPTGVATSNANWTFLIAAWTSYALMIPVDVPTVQQFAGIDFYGVSNGVQGSSGNSFITGAVYNDDGTGTAPALAQSQIAVTTSIDPTKVVGDVAAPWIGSSPYFSPKRYWLALCFQQGSAGVPMATMPAVNVYEMLNQIGLYAPGASSMAVHTGKAWLTQISATGSPGNISSLIPWSYLPAIGFRAT